ncbi:hypothetical protein [Proteus hauseri]|nr:hypothetical protein [Proteus hauseri]
MDHTVNLPSICAVYPSTRHLSPKVRYFLDFIEEQWQGDAIWRITQY